MKNNSVLIPVVSALYTFIKFSGRFIASASLDCSKISLGAGAFIWEYVGTLYLSLIDIFPGVGTSHDVVYFFPF